MNLTVIPVTIREWKKVNALKGQGKSSMSGEQLDLIGYPEPVYSDDIMASGSKMVRSGGINRLETIEGRTCYT